MAGDAAAVTRRLNRLLDAGADSIGLWLFPPTQLSQQLERLAADVLPAVPVRGGR